MSLYEERPWGNFTLLYQSDVSWVKVLEVNPGQSLSLQYHEERTETWVPEETGLHAEIGDVSLVLEAGEQYTVGIRQTHRISNPTDKPIRLVELATGRPDEYDIVRLEDTYGRA